MKYTRYLFYSFLIIVVIGSWFLFNFWMDTKAIEGLNKHYVMVDKSIWENPLVNSLFIPLGLYLGKKLIDVVFLRFENKKG